jgi:hypothetical protein
MSPYKVVLGDNFHKREEDERSEYGTFATAEEALEPVVGWSMRRCWRNTDEETADQLFERYEYLGDTPFVVALDPGPKVEFSAWTYTQRRALELVAGQKAGRTAKASPTAGAPLLGRKPAIVSKRDS